MKLSEEERKEAENKAYRKAGHNAYFGNGFQAGIDFMLKKGFHYSKEEMDRAFDEGASAAADEITRKI